VHYGIRDAFYLYFDLPLRNKLKSGEQVEERADYGIRDAFYLYFDLPLRNKLKSGSNIGLWHQRCLLSVLRLALAEQVEERSAAAGGDYGIRDAFYLYFDLPLRNNLYS
jgi:hypothetical protein